MAALEFSNKSSRNPALYLAPAAKFWNAYLVSKGTTPPKSGTIAFKDTPQYQGFYIFAPEAPSDINTFVSNAYQYFNTIKQDDQSGAIVWFQAPNEKPSKSNVQLIFLQAQGIEKFTLLKSYNYNFGNNFCTLTLTPSLGVVINLDTTNNRFVISGPPNPNFISFSANNIASQTKPAEELEIPLTGNAMASIRFLIGLNHATDFKAFDTSQKFFYHEKLTKKLREISYPVFQIGSQNNFVSFQASINPLDMLNSSSINTYLAFLGKSKSEEDQIDTVMGSNFQSVFGASVNLIPVLDFSTSLGSSNIPNNNSSLLVFSERSPSNKTDNWYMVPSGYFKLHSNAEDIEALNNNNAFKLLCGISGTESINTTVQTKTIDGDYMRFIDKQAAYAPVFPFEAVSNRNQSEKQDKLNSKFITSWVNIIPNNKNHTPYSGQPESGPLYTKVNSLGSNEQVHSDILNPFFPEVQYPDDICFPMVPYGGLIENENKFNGIKIEDIRNYEIQIINSTRKKIISESSRFFATQNDTGVTATNNDGFIITLKNTGQWDEILFARNNDLEFKFSGFGKTLQNAFQSNQQFIVASNKTHFGDFSNKIPIEDWQFDVNTPDKTNFGNYKDVILFKYCKGSIEDLVKNPKLWTQAEDFNGEDELNTLSSWIQEYIEDAKNTHDSQSESKSSPLKKFIQVVTNPEWNGILIIKADIDLKEMPDELQGLIGGIDIDKFYAHHIGIEVNKVAVENENTIVLKENSSLFGLINYIDEVYKEQLKKGESPETPVPPTPKCIYDFKVLKLQVLFENSKIKDFQSKAQLTANRLFSDKVTKIITNGKDNLTNSIVFDGSCQRHSDGSPLYIFDTAVENKFCFNSNLLPYIDVVKAQFNTTQKQGESVSKVHSRFMFWGKMDFKKLPCTDGKSKKQIDFDILSFGGKDEKDTTSGLCFSNLSINMDFDISTPTVKSFTFDANEIAFDVSKSTIRDSSLYKNFSLQINKFICGNKDTQPSDLGYLDIRMPEFTGNGVKNNWYGIEYKLDMGTPGELAAKAGFYSSLLIAWSPGGKSTETSYNVFAGIKLPGTEGAKLFGIQGVLKIGIASIQLFYSNDEKSFLMKLNDIALKFLGLLKLPPGSTTSFFLYGDPQGKKEGLGWFAAYNKNE